MAKSHWPTLASATPFNTRHLPLRHATVGNFPPCSNNLYNLKINGSEPASNPYGVNCFIYWCVSFRASQDSLPIPPDPSRWICRVTMPSHSSQAALPCIAHAAMSLYMINAVITIMFFVGHCFHTVPAESLTRRYILISP